MGSGGHSRHVITVPGSGRATAVPDVAEVAVMEEALGQGATAHADGNNALYFWAGTALMVSGSWLEPGKALTVSTDQVVRTSQGERTLTTRREYQVDSTGTLLTLTEQRASRPSPVILLFRRAVVP